MTGADEFRRVPLPVDLDRLLHDLRGPLNAAVMHLEVLKRLGGDEPMARTSVHSIQQELERLTAMLPVAFAICALEKAAPRPVLLRAVVEAALDDPTRKRVTIDPPGDWPQVDGDEALLVMAVRHLIVNALEAGGEDGAVRVSVETADADKVTIVIRDTGGGFKTRNPNAIVRLMSTTKGGHVGIGLMIAQRVARLHGGTLSFESTPAGGVVRLVLAR